MERKRVSLQLISMRCLNMLELGGLPYVDNYPSCQYILLS